MKRTINCPNCSVAIPAQALLCWACDHAFDNEQFYCCVDCRRAIRINARICRYCRSKSDRPSQYLAERVATQFRSESAHVADLFSKLYAFDCYGAINDEQLRAIIDNLSHVLLKAGPKRSEPVPIVDECLRIAVAATVAKEIIRLVRGTTFGETRVRALGTLVNFINITNERRSAAVLTRPSLEILVSRVQEMRMSDRALIEALWFLAASYVTGGDMTQYEKLVDRMLKLSMSSSAIPPNLRMQSMRLALNNKIEKFEFGEVYSIAQQYLMLLQSATSPYWGEPHPNPEPNWANEIAHAHYASGMAQQGLGNYAQAIKMFEASVDVLRPHYGEEYALRQMSTIIAQCYESLNDDQQATVYYDIAISKLHGSGRARAIVKLARLHLRTNQPDRLSKDFHYMRETNNASWRSGSRKPSTDVELAEANTELAQLLLESSMWTQARSCAAFAIVTYQRALSAWSSTDASEHLRRIWRLVEKTQRVVAAVIADSDPSGAETVSKQANLIAAHGYSPDSLMYLIGEIAVIQFEE